MEYWPVHGVSGIPHMVLTLKKRFNCIKVVMFGAMMFAMREGNSSHYIHVNVVYILS